MKHACKLCHGEGWLSWSFLGTITRRECPRCHGTKFEPGSVVKDEHHERLRNVGNLGQKK